MKVGFTVSLIAHLLFLAILFVTFAAPPLPENPDAEDIPIELVPLADQMALQKGQTEAALKKKAAEKPTQKHDAHPEAENVGDAEIDTKMPLKPKEKPREVKTAPPVAGEETSKVEQITERQPQPAEKPQTAPMKPTPPGEQPKPAEKKSPPPDNLAEPKDDIGELLKSDKEQEKPEKPKEEPKVQEKPKPELPLLPQKAPLPTPSPREETEKTERSKGEKDGVKEKRQQDALIDRTRTSGGGAKSSRDEVAFGAQKNIGNGTELQQTLNNIIGSCVARNWDIGVIQGSSAYDLRVQMHFRLNRDGSLVADPDLSPSGGDQKDRDVISVQARTALKKCAPFKLPPEKYDQWHDVTVNMRAFPE